MKSYAWLSSALAVPRNFAGRLVHLGQGLPILDPYVPRVKRAAATAQGLDAARPSVQMAFACENVSTDPGPVSFQNVMDGIAADDFPAPTGRWFSIFCFFSHVEMTIANCRVVISDELGAVIAQRAVKDLKFTADNPISRNVIGFQGLAWPHAGGYVIEFIGNRADVLASFPMWVQQAPAAAGETQGGT